jgi:hypothetical protein
VPFEERDVTRNPQHMDELRALMGRFVTPTIVIGKEVLLGFGMNFDRIIQLVGAKPGA